MPVKIDIRFNEDMIKEITGDKRGRLADILNRVLREERKMAVDAITGDVRLPKAYVTSKLRVKPATPNNLETTLGATHTPVTIRAGTYNPSHTVISGVSFAVSRKKPIKNRKKWFMFGLRGSGYKVAAYRTDKRVAYTTKSGKRSTRKALKVAYAPSVNQVLHDVIRTDKGYTFNFDTRQLLVKVTIKEFFKA